MGQVLTGWNQAIVRREHREAKKDLVALVTCLKLEIVENSPGTTKIIFVRNPHGIGGVSALIQTEEGGKQVFRSDAKMAGVKYRLDHTDIGFPYVLEV